MKSVFVLAERCPMVMVGAFGCSLPLDEVVEEVLDALLHLRFLHRDGIKFVGDLHHQLPQFVQLTFDLEEALCCQSKPASEGAQTEEALFPIRRYGGQWGGAEYAL